MTRPVATKGVRKTRPVAAEEAPKRAEPLAADRRLRDILGGVRTSALDTDGTVKARDALHAAAVDDGAMRRLLAVAEAAERARLGRSEKARAQQEKRGNITREQVEVAFYRLPDELRAEPESAPTIGAVMDFMEEAFGKTLTDKHYGTLIRDIVGSAKNEKSGT